MFLVESSGHNITLDNGIVLIVGVLNDGQSILWKTANFSEKKTDKKVSGFDTQAMAICKEVEDMAVWRHRDEVRVSVKSCGAVALYTTYIMLDKFINTVTFGVGNLIFVEEKYW